MPFAPSGPKIFGPGVFDMKAGIVQALFALDALLATHAPVRKQIVFLWTSDEEIGSESSRKLWRRKPHTAMLSSSSNRRSDQEAS